LPGSKGPVFHAHCLGLCADGRTRFRSHRAFFEDARAEFLRRYASGTAFDRRALYPLISSRA